MRIVSTLPAATEIVYALGERPVGVSHECDHPTDACERPQVTATRITEDADATRIAEQVAAHREAGVFEVRTERLASLEPDLVIGQAVCDVCAVGAEDVLAAVDMIDIDPSTLTTDPHSLGDVFDGIRRVGGAIDRQEAADRLLADLHGRVDDVRERAAAIDSSHRPSVCVLDWPDPPMTAGHWVPELVDIAGGHYLPETTHLASVPREWETLRSCDPDVLIIAPCGLDVETAGENLHALADRPGWGSLSAVHGDRVWLVDGNGHVNRPGPRLVDTLEAFAGILHPERFDPPGEEVARRMIQRTM